MRFQNYEGLKPETEYLCLLLAVADDGDGGTVLGVTERSVDRVRGMSVHATVRDNDMLSKAHDSVGLRRAVEVIRPAIRGVSSDRPDIMVKLALVASSACGNVVSGRPCLEIPVAPHEPS